PRPSRGRSSSRPTAGSSWRFPARGPSRSASSRRTTTDVHALLAPWSHAFMQRALVELVLVAVAGGVLGCWVVFYELAYSAESLAHALFPGLVGAALLGLPLVAGGAVGVAGAAAAVAILGR